MILGDWGSTRLRLWRHASSGLERTEGPGIVGLADPASSLLAALAPWQPAATILLCGMAGSRNGLAETPYADCPVTVAGWVRGGVSLHLGGTRIRITPGVACRRNGAADVMRGEEAQIFGALALKPALAHGTHLLVLPGTHCKWAWIENGRIIGFQTYLTGELFALLADHSSLTKVDPRAHGEADGFQAGLARAAIAGLHASLFEARAAQLQDGQTGGWARGFLSGLLIGSEVADALSRMATTAATLIGSPALTQAYRTAFAAHGIQTMLLDGDACVLAGLSHAAAET